MSERASECVCVCMRKIERSLNYLKIYRRRIAALSIRSGRGRDFKTVRKVWPGVNRVRARLMLFNNGAKGGVRARVAARDHNFRGDLSRSCGVYHLTDT